MAQIINKTITSGPSAAMDELISDLRSVFAFERYDAENQRLYITDETYIYIDGYSSSFKIAFGNSNGQLLQLSESSVNAVYYQIIKTTSGDVVLRLHKQALVDNKYLQLAIVKVKNSEGDVSYAIYTPAYTAPDTTVTSLVTTVYGTMTLIADDTTSAGYTAVNSSADSASPNVTPVNFGFNAASQSAKLIQVFSTYSDNMTLNARIMAQTPRPYNGECLINGRQYYCVSFMAFLDE